MSSEEYREVPGFSNYQIPNKGNLLRKGKQVKGYKNRLYIGANLRQDGRRLSSFRHRLVLLSFVGPCPEGLEACHDDGNGFNNNLDNLRWDTHSANMYDKIKHGTAHDTRGEKHGSAILTEEDVLCIREQSSNGVSTKDLAAKFGRHEAYMRSVINGARWKHLPGAHKRKPGPTKKSKVKR